MFIKSICPNRTAPSAPRIHPHRSAHRSDPAQESPAPSRYDFDRLFRSTTGWTLPMGSFIPQCLDRIERRGATRGIQSEENPDRRRHGHGDHDGLQRKHHLPSREPRNRKSEQDAGQNTDPPPTPLMTTASIQKLPENLPARRDRPPYPDLADPLRRSSMMFMIRCRRPGARSPRSPPARC